MSAAPMSAGMAAPTPTLVTLLRVYIPFGSEWYPYLMRRLAERPANAIFILKNLFRR